MGQEAKYFDLQYQVISVVSCAPRRSMVVSGSSLTTTPCLLKHLLEGSCRSSIHNHPDRLKMPLKRVGERGEDRWEEIP